MTTFVDNYLKNCTSDKPNQYVRMVREFEQHGKTHDKEGVQRYVKWMQKQGYADGTVELRYRTIHQAFKYNNIVWPLRRGEGPQIREHNVRAIALPKEIIRRMAHAALDGTIEPIPAAYLAISSIYGTRAGEMAQIAKKDISLAEQTIYIHTEKHGRERYHYIPEEIFPFIEAVHKHWHQRSNNVLWKIYRYIEEQIELPHTEGVGWHSFRRSLEHFGIEGGITQSSMSSFMRWKRDRQNIEEGYHNAQILGQDGTLEHASSSDTTKDREEIFPKHPFLPYWRGE